MEAYVNFLYDNLDKWRAGREVFRDKEPIKVPTLEEACSIAIGGIVQFNSDLAMKAAQAEAEEKRKHMGFPLVMQ